MRTYHLVFGSAKHCGLKDDVKAFHGNSCMAILDNRDDTLSEELPVIQRFRSQEFEQRIQFLHVILRCY